jgi:NADPH:quinone reductase-like Zn-dependent oxidoreductase
VPATIRSDAADLVRGFGAERVIDVRTESFEGSGPYDVIVDTVGGETLQRSFAVLRGGGRLVTLSGPPPAGTTAMFFIVTPNREQLAELAALVDSGRLRVPIAETFPLAEGREAFESGRRRDRRPGKTVLVVS